MAMSSHNRMSTKKRLKQCSIREPKLFQPNPVLVEMVDPNRTGPKPGFV